MYMSCSIDNNIILSLRLMNGEKYIPIYYYYTYDVRPCNALECSRINIMWYGAAAANVLVIF